MPTKHSSAKRRESSIAQWLSAKKRGNFHPFPLRRRVCVHMYCKSCVQIYKRSREQKETQTCFLQNGRNTFQLEFLNIQAVDLTMYIQAFPTIPVRSQIQTSEAVPENHHCRSPKLLPGELSAALDVETRTYSCEWTDELEHHLTCTVVLCVCRIIVPNQR
jgi:hypothetical protein